MIKRILPQPCTLAYAFPLLADICSGTHLRQERIPSALAMVGFGTSTETSTFSQALSGYMQFQGRPDVSQLLWLSPVSMQGG